MQRQGHQQVWPGPTMNGKCTQYKNCTWQKDYCYHKPPDKLQEIDMKAALTVAALTACVRLIPRHTLFIEVLVRLGGGCQELPQGSRNGQVLDVCRQRLASYHSAYPGHQIGSHSFWLHRHRHISEQHCQHIIVTSGSHDKDIHRSSKCSTDDRADSQARQHMTSYHMAH